jgi:alpha-aminoadipate carrier protein LysW
MVETTCPDCLGELEVLDDAMVGEIVSCPDCGLELEVEAIEGDNVTLQILTIEKEDWGQ